MKSLILISLLTLSLNSFAQDCSSIADKAAAKAAQERLNPDGHGTLTSDSGIVTELTKRFQTLKVYGVQIGDEVGYTDWLVVTTIECKILSIHMGAME